MMRMNSCLIWAAVVPVVLQHQFTLVRSSENQSELEIISLVVQKTSPTGAFSGLSNFAF
jgi:hypothetical protein